MTPMTRTVRPMLNQKRREQFLDLMAINGWDLLLLYGHSWRKDFFRSLINFNFLGPHAAAALRRSGEISLLLSHSWDDEPLAGALDIETHWTADFGAGLDRLLSGRGPAKTAIAGMELMEARFVHAIRGQIPEEPISATEAIEKLRRLKTPDEINIIRQAPRLADL